MYRNAFFVKKEKNSDDTVFNFTRRKKAGTGGVRCPKRKEKIIKNKNQETVSIFLTGSSYRKVYESVTVMLKTENQAIKSTILNQNFTVSRELLVNQKK